METKAVSQHDTSKTIDNDVRYVLTEIPINELLAEITKAALSSQIVLPENVSELLIKLQSETASVETFRTCLRQVQNEQPIVYNILMKTIFEFIGNVDQIFDLSSEWLHGLDVMNWKLDRMGDRMRRLTDYITQATEDL